MATFTFSNKKQEVENKQKKTSTFKKNIKINLIKHSGLEYSPEYYTYIDVNGNVNKYSGLVYKNEDGSYFGKNIITHKIILTFHPTVNSVEHKDEYFSYIDMDGNEKVFNGEPKFDLDKNSYYGEVIETIQTDEVVKIYKEA